MIRNSFGARGRLTIGGMSYQVSGWTRSRARRGCPTA